MKADIGRKWLWQTDTSRPLLVELAKPQSGISIVVQWQAQSFFTNMYKPEDDKITWLNSSFTPLNNAVIIHHVRNKFSRCGCLGSFVWMNHIKFIQNLIWRSLENSPAPRLENHYILFNHIVFLISTYLMFLAFFLWLLFIMGLWDNYSCSARFHLTLLCNTYESWSWSHLLVYINRLSLTSGMAFAMGFMIVPCE